MVELPQHDTVLHQLQRAHPELSPEQIMEFIERQMAASGSGDDGEGDDEGDGGGGEGGGGDDGDSGVGGDGSDGGDGGDSNADDGVGDPGWGWRPNVGDPEWDPD